MEVKSIGAKGPTVMSAKGPTVSEPSARQLTPGIVEYVGEVKEELKKITWTSREELIVYTRIVVVATFALGLGIYMMDLIIQTLLNGLEYFVRLITG